MHNKPIIPAGDKFALLCFADLSHVHRDFAFTGQLKGFEFATASPSLEEVGWSELLGSLRYEQIKKSNYCILIHQPSTDLGTINAENNVLRTKIHYLYVGFAIRLPFVSHRESYRVSGSMKEDGIEIRQTAFYEALPALEGAPTQSISEEILEDSIIVSEALDYIYSGSEFIRLWAMIDAYLHGLRSKDIGFRIHQFTRCLEGMLFLSPRNATKDFKSRSALFFKRSQSDLMGKIYKIRSKVEHLSGALENYSGIDKTIEKRDVFLKAIQVEYLAGRVLSNILLNPKVLSLFRSNEDLEKFWTLPVKSQRDIFNLCFDGDEVFNSLGQTEDEYD